MQFATHYYLLIGEGEGKGKGEGGGEGGGARGRDIRKLFIIYNFWVFVQFI